MGVDIRGVIYNDLYGLLEFSAGNHKKRIFLVEDTVRFSYIDFLSLVDQFSGLLNSLGISPGSKVCLFLPNSVYMVCAYFAIWRLGAVAVPVNYMWKEEELAYVVKNSDAELIITTGEKFVMAAGLKRRIERLRHILDIGNAVDKLLVYPIPPRVMVKEQQPAIIIYTSGTTGRPKGAMLSHYNLLSNVRSCNLALEFSKKDVVPCFLPLFHSFAVTVCLLVPVSAGAKVVLIDATRGIKQMFFKMIRERSTVFVGIPPVFSLMAEARLPTWLPNWLMRFLFPVRVAISGSSALPVEVLKRFEERYRIPLLEGYGLTEASPVVSLNPINAPRHGSVGLPVADVEVKIVDEKGQECPESRVGEILVKGPNVMLGYYKRLLDTKAVLKNGWLHTGDLGHKDRDGYLYIVGRKKEMIIVRGLNVYPREIEDAINSLREVKESAVVGLKHKTKGEIPVAFVVLKKGMELSSREILAYLKSKLADYKVPSRVIFLEELPRNSLRKVQKDKLISMLSKESV